MKILLKRDNKVLADVTNCTAQQFFSLYTHRKLNAGNGLYFINLKDYFFEVIYE